MNPNSDLTPVIDTSKHRLVELPSTQQLVEESLIYNGIENILSNYKSKSDLADEDSTKTMVPPASDTLYFKDRSRNIDLWSFLRRLRVKGLVQTDTLTYSYCLLLKIEKRTFVDPHVIVKLFIGLLYTSMKYLFDDDYFVLEDYA